MEFIKSYIVKGKVQGVMFRQTLIRAALNRALEGGATNDPINKNLVRFTLRGDESAILEIITKLTSGDNLNSWGAKVDTLEELGEVLDINVHQVTTHNVDSFNWSGGVEFYL
ncbi:MAG: acylphosphatase [Bacteriovoracaceae bacterium]|nr:acylphosphatase [Bacteriovoracaceae bacterium]